MSKTFDKLLDDYGLMAWAGPQAVEERQAARAAIIAYVEELERENAELKSRDERNNQWFKDNAGVLCSHRIGGFSFADDWCPSSNST